LGTAGFPPDVTRLVRPEIRALGGYAAHTSPDTLDKKALPRRIIKLDANENPYGCSPEVWRALAACRDWSVYPDARQTVLRSQLQSYTGAPADSIVAATGSGELLDDILCLFLGAGDEVINCIPTFDLFRLRTLIHGGSLVTLPRRDDFSVDIAAVKAAITPRTKMIILANPNNPTGNAIPQEDIIELADTGVPLLMDEAYYEFCGETVVPLVGRYRNLMVLRTFSKWAGLAGLRVGYGVFDQEIAASLMKIKLPYNVNLAALIAVEASLKDRAYLETKVKAIIEERERMFGLLRALPWLRPYPSRANYILCDVLAGSARTLHRRLEERGILVRYFNQTFLENSLRISAGRPEDTDAVIAALRELEGRIND